MPLEKLTRAETAALKGMAPDPVIAEYARIPQELGDDALAALRELGFQLVHEPGLQDFILA